MNLQHKTTRDITLEMKGMLEQYIKDSTSRREICGKRFEACDKTIEKLDDRQWKTALALAAMLGAWEWAKRRIGL